MKGRIFGDVSGQPYAWTNRAQANACKAQLQAVGFNVEVVRIESYCYHVALKGTDFLVEQDAIGIGGELVNKDLLTQTMWEYIDAKTA